MARTTSKGHISISGEIHREDDQYVATIERLNVSSFGSSVDEAMNAVLDALAVYIDTLSEEGLLQDTLNETGIPILWGREPEVEFRINCRVPTALTS